MEQTAKKEGNATSAKSNMPLGYTDYSQRKGHMKKMMTTILFQCHEEMRKRNSVKAHSSKLAHTEVISMCVIPVKVKYKDSDAFYNTFVMLDHLKKNNFMAPFYGRGSTTSRLEPLRGGSLLFTFYHFSQ